MAEERKSQVANRLELNTRRAAVASVLAAKTHRTRKEGPIAKEGNRQIQTGATGLMKHANNSFNAALEKKTGLKTGKKVETGSKEENRMIHKTTKVVQAAVKHARKKKSK